MKTRAVLSVAMPSPQVSDEEGGSATANLPCAENTEKIQSKSSSSSSYHSRRVFNYYKDILINIMKGI
ncbi:unnamed protein product [Prunus armeniaca]|uniref:Uncharacterized protein n=1 Tax=Prunus armeniaca TaxID=36596 RepID=A0A6J5WDM8_PRUAR|nr:hypothetical protein GBA52_008702 [Prunus armeniaca]CAB4268018.1 unnamed protein product [Prunus armeniaca]CAB4298443.1 unnamed protein product [Prunus armeniaca]